MSRKGNVLLLVLIGIMAVLMVIAGLLWWKASHPLLAHPIGTGSCAKDSNGNITETYPGKCGVACKTSDLGYCLPAPLQGKEKTN